MISWFSSRGMSFSPPGSLINDPASFFLKMVLLVPVFSFANPYTNVLLALAASPLLFFLRAPRAGWTRSFSWRYELWSLSTAGLSSLSFQPCFFLVCAEALQDNPVRMIKHYPSSQPQQRFSRAVLDSWSLLKEVPCFSSIEIQCLSSPLLAQVPPFFLFLPFYFDVILAGYFPPMPRRAPALVSRVVFSAFDLFRLLH